MFGCHFETKQPEKVVKFLAVTKKCKKKMLFICVWRGKLGEILDLKKLIAKRKGFHICLKNKIDETLGFKMLIPKIDKDLHFVKKLPPSSKKILPAITPFKLNVTLSKYLKIDFSEVNLQCSVSTTQIECGRCYKDRLRLDARGVSAHYLLQEVHLF